MSRVLAKRSPLCSRNDGVPHDSLGLPLAAHPQRLIMADPLAAAISIAFHGLAFAMVLYLSRSGFR